MATTADTLFAVGDVEENDLLVGDGTDLAVVGGLAPPELAAVGTRGLCGGAADGSGAEVGPSGLHGLRAPVGLVTHPPARRPYLVTSSRRQNGCEPVGIGEKCRF